LTELMAGSSREARLALRALFHRIMSVRTIIEGVV
jgi:hypothetical protein